MNLREYAARLQQLAGDQAGRAVFFKQTTDTLAGEVLRRARKRTPVGQGVFEPVLKAEDAADSFAAKMSGGKRSRRSYYSWKQIDDDSTGKTYWKLGKSSKKQGGLRLRRVRSGGQLRRNWFATPAKVAGNRYEAEVANPTKYAMYVEYGHRQHVGQFVPVLGKRLKKPWVNGRFMLRKAHEEVKEKAPAYLQRELDRYLRRYLP